MSWAQRPWMLRRVLLGRLRNRPLDRRFFCARCAVGGGGGLIDRRNAHTTPAWRVTGTAAVRQEKLDQREKEDRRRRGREPFDPPDRPVRRVDAHGVRLVFVGCFDPAPGEREGIRGGGAVGGRGRT